MARQEALGDGVKDGNLPHALLLESLPDALVLYDLEGRVRYLNAAFRQMYGWELREVLGKPMPFVPRDEVDRTEEGVRVAVTSSESVVLTTRRLTRDGRVLHVEVKTAGFSGGGGIPAGLFVIHRDLTDRLAARAALQESEARYLILLDASPDPITVYDHEGRITYLNPAFVATFGWTLEELEGRGIDFVPSSEKEKTWEAVQAIMQGKSVSLGTRRLTKDGRILDIFLKTGCFFDVDGNVAGNVIIYRDETDRNRAEQELELHRNRLEELVQARTRELLKTNRQLAREVEERRKTERALRENEERFRAMAELLPEIIFEADLDGRLTFVNRKAAETTGRAPEAFLEGLTISDLFAEADRDRAAEARAEVLAGKRTRGTEYRLLRTDGSTVPVLAFSAPIVSRGNVVGLRGIIVDVSRLKQMEHQLGHAAKMEAVGTLAGGIAHDFNNILQVVTGFIDLMAEDQELAPEHKNSLCRMEGATARAADLVKDLMAFSRKGEPTLCPTDLNPLVENIVRILERTLPKMIEVDIQLEPVPPLILADEGQIERALLNLGTNARDAMGDEGHLTFETENVVLDERFCTAHPEARPGPHLLVRVTDTGHGMDAKTSSHIFEPFFTTKGVGEGTGLGLAMTYGTVKAHGGLIYCDSQPGQGTSFNLFFPAMDEGTRVRGGAHARGVATRSAPGRGESILLVDDEDTIRDLVAASLERQGYRVVEAATGEEALARLAEHGDQVRLVLLDLGMPGMGGRRCLEEIRARELPVKVLVLTGYAKDQQALGIVEAGADALLSKPYRLRTLAARVRDLLDV